VAGLVSSLDVAHRALVARIGAVEQSDDDARVEDQRCRSSPSWSSFPAA
jgi:hypothetical protein